MSGLELQGETVLVTGAAGFIGSHLVEALLSRGARVRGLDNLATGNLGNLAGVLSRMDFRLEDIRDADACARACEGTSIVFHQAALGSVPRSIEDPATTVAVNVSGTANLFASACRAGARRVVYASSSSVYGDCASVPKREGEEGVPLSPYAASKSMVEKLAAVFGSSYSQELVGLRYFNVYGPRQDPEGPYAAVIPRFFHAYLSGRAPVIFGDGTQTRDFTFVADAVSANLLAAAAPSSACGRAYNVGGGRRTAVRELALLVREAVGDGREPTHAPPRAGDVPHSLADLTRVREALGYQPQWSLSRGLSRSLEFYAQSLASDSARSLRGGGAG